MSEFIPVLTQVQQWLRKPLGWVVHAAHGGAVLILFPPASEALVALQSSDGADYLGGASESSGCHSTQNPKLNKPSP